MAIQFIKSYAAKDGEVFAKIEDAQRHELEILLPSGATTEKSRPKMRTINGATRKNRTPKTPELVAKEAPNA